MAQSSDRTGHSTRRGEPKPTVAGPATKNGARDLTSLAHGLGTTIARVARLARVPLQEQGISASRMRVLALLDDHGPQRVARLAELDQVSQPSVTAMVEAVSQRGWVTRSPDPTDRRAVLVQLTESGRRQLKHAQTTRSVALAERIAELSDDEIATLDQALPALESLLEIMQSYENSQLGDPPSGRKETVQD